MSQPNDMTTDHILQAHGYCDGTEKDRLMSVFKDMARGRAVLAVYDLVLSPQQRAHVELGIQMLVDK